MTCPHCGFLMSPLDNDCARCRHRGYVPPAPPSVPTPDTQHPTPNYAYSPQPLPPNPSAQPAFHALTVVACLMSVAMLTGMMMFGLMRRERRAARQEAEIAALQQQLAQTRQVEVNAPISTLTLRPQIISVEVAPPVNPVYVPVVPVYPVYDPVADHMLLRRESMFQQQRMLQQQTDDMMRHHAETVERMNADMQRMRDRMEDARLQSQYRTRDPRDPFNPYGRF